VTKQKHVIISISGDNHSGRSILAAALSARLNVLGIMNVIISPYSEQQVPLDQALARIDDMVKGGIAPHVEILDGVENRGVTELRAYIAGLDSELRTLGVVTEGTSFSEVEAARKTAVALHCQKLSIPLALGTYYLKEVYPKRGFKDAVE
jgi:hypothetical protein